MNFSLSFCSLNIHFIHAKPTKTDGKKVLPLLLMHGWPGSVREFYDFIPLLTTGSDKSEYVFEVIAPSLPGYGWSQVRLRWQDLQGNKPKQLTRPFTYLCRVPRRRALVQLRYRWLCAI